MKDLSGKCFLKESVAVGSCSRSWNATDGSRRMEQPPESIRDRQGFLIKCSLSHGDYHLLFISHEIMKNMAHIPFTPGNTKSTEQLCEKLTLFM